MNILQALLWNVFSPISKSIKLVYGWGDSDFEWAVNAANISFMLALVPVNKLYARYGARCTMLLSTVSLAFCGLIRCLPLEGHAFMMMVQLSMLANGMTAAWANIAGPLISDVWFPARERTLATAVAVTGPPVGQALGFVVGPSMVTTVDTLWLVRREVQSLMWLEASLCLAVLLATIIYFPSAPSSPPSESAAVKRGSSTGTYAQLFPTSRQACRFWILNLSFAIPIGAYQSWAGVLNLNLAQTNLGISPRAVALLGCLMTLSGAAGSIAIGLVTKRLLGALKSIILLSAAFSALGFLVFAVLLTFHVDSSALLLGVTGVIGGFGVNCMPPLFFELILETVYGFVSDNLAASTMMLTVSLVQILVLAVPLKIGGSSLWMNWLMVISTVLCFVAVLPFRARYLRLETDLGEDFTSTCDRMGCF
ncbi:Solute carrier family 49 member 4 homolog (Disrupted in renal carcinoma protein 2 homolog) [Durusdinium trenchii]|uniref:Solute carrier family 49 member 4 homolog (Disrupted in renal carcinoma protein 2 homolog) n=1 Tax=Durusdinium trenchii TaxID=1381693 RepID=A0ABP0MMZ2_9DINO